MTSGSDPAPVRDPTRLTPRRWYLMTGGWALLLVPQIAVAATTDAPVLVRVLLVGVVLVYIATYMHGLYLAMTRRRPLTSAAVLVLLAAAWTGMVLGIGRNDGGVLYTVTYLLVAVVVLVPPPFGAPAALLTCAAALGVGTLAGEHPDWGDAFSLVAVGLGMISLFGLVRVNVQLREAREELARMAVTAERERMARDLHDVLGHSLTTITVKAGLARRLLESGRPERAAEEVGDVERLGRQALADVRATVAANRVTSLAAELAGAREALRAAEIRADLPQAVDDVPPERQEAFAHVVREGVTNTIRHSGARTCTVRLTPDSVEVLDDGAGRAADGDGTPGTGLRGLGERLAAVGGRVEAEPAPGGGYRLRAECAPARRRARRTEPV